MFRPHMIRRFRREILLAVFTALVLPIPVLSVSMDHGIGSIDSVIPIDVQSVTRSIWDRAGSWRCHESFVEEPGWLVVDVTTPADSTAPRFRALDSIFDTDSKERAVFSVSNPSISGGLLTVRQPGFLYLCVGPRDPALELGAYRLMSRFWSPASFSEGQRRSFSVLEIEDPEEDEPDLDPLVDPSCEPWVPVAEGAFAQTTGGRQTDQGIIQVEDPEEDEPDLDPCAPPIPDQARVPMDRLCGLNEGDDHSDSMGCGTVVELGTLATGRIANDWRDDQDTFRFTLERTATVRLRLAADFSHRLDLFDARGVHLNLDRLQGSNAYGAQVLPEGDYVLRIKGLDYGEGSYILTLEH